MSKVLLVTGGSRGIGAATAKMANAAGYAVAINYQSDKAAAEAAAQGLKNAIIVQGDVSKPEDVARMFDETEAALGKVTHVFNSAGVTGKSSRLVDAPLEVIRQTIDINLMGAIYVSREAVKRMSTRLGGKGGVIVHVSSAAVVIGSPGEYVWYAASKGGVESLTFGLSKEVVDEGIRVNAVVPGMVETEIHARSSGDAARVERIRPSIPMKRIGKPEEIASVAMFLLGDESSYMTGATVRVSGGR
ncbi:SDR family oxidoreductase [Aestuariivirga litoralis]|uniref:SDR family oxidoreductase n=1 Tax=Aestuariivirga litoralis TaxID=2650924 RepID=UPI0018C496FC|nr:SDR family oxidoreductase [Aestuariivirga litoralis]MBG1232730.1 SDR family oxidoreductase [Aestuariivirga litoralis]